VHAIRKGNVSVTPITLDCTAFGGMDPLSEIFNDVN
jgi:5'-nucleotidase